MRDDRRRRAREDGRGAPPTSTSLLNANRSSPPAASASSDRKKPFVTDLKNRGARESEMLKAGFDPALLFDAKTGRRIRQRGRVIAEELIKPVWITLV